MYRALPRELRNRGRRIPADRLHVTLAFLGDVGEDRLDAIARVASACVADRPAFELKLDRLGRFPRPQVLWLGSQMLPAPLLEMVWCLRQGLGVHGFEIDKRTFQPHVTLLRKAHFEGRLPGVEPVSWKVDGVSLIASDTRPEGAVYAELKRWPLAAGVCDNPR